MSLSKNIANSLGLQLLFDPNYITGSKFSILIPISKCSFGIFRISTNESNESARKIESYSLNNNNSNEEVIRNSNNNIDGKKYLNNNIGKRKSSKFNLQGNGPSSLSNKGLMKIDTDLLLGKHEEKNKNFPNTEKSMYLPKNSNTDNFDKKENENQDTISEDIHIIIKNFTNRAKPNIDLVSSSFEGSNINYEDRESLSITHENDINKTPCLYNEGEIGLSSSSLKTLVFNKPIDFYIDPCVKRNVNFIFLFFWFFYI